MASAEGTQPTRSSMPSLLFSAQGRLFVAHVAILLSALMFLQPLNRSWSRVAWRILTQLCAVSSAYKVYLKFGLPTVRPFSAALASIKDWMQRAGTATDFHYLILSALFATAPRPIALAAVPFVVLAAFHASAFASQHLGHTAIWQRYGRPAHQWLASKQQEALVLNAGAEIGLGFLTVLLLIWPPRNLLLPFMVWQTLRMRYWSPDAASYHRQVWGMLDQRFQPLANAVPMLRTPVGWVQKYFANAVQPVQQRTQ